MELTRRGRRLADLCRDLHVLAQDAPGGNASAGPARGWAWEARIARTLAMRGYPVDSVPGGIRVLGVMPASGLRHQTDAALHCEDAHVIGEWKSFAGPVPKNEVLRFKAATDDLYESLSARTPARPVLRLFGVGGDVSTELRWYAARHGITLVERGRWPVPVLTDPGTIWPTAAGPSHTDLTQLRWLSRPLQQVYPRLPDGSLRLPPAPASSAIEALLALQERWSRRLWSFLDATPGAFEQYAADLVA